MKDFYLNPRNEHIQAYYTIENVERTYEEFYQMIINKQSMGNKKFI